MAKIKNKAAEVAFKILWALVAKKARFEDQVIEPLQNTISNTQTKADALLKELKNNVFIAFKLKKGEAVTMQIIEDGKLKNIVLRGQDDLTWVEDKIWSLQCDVNSCTEELNKAKAEMDKAKKQLAAIKGQITKAQKAYENA